MGFTLELVCRPTIALWVTLVHWSDGGGVLIRFKLGCQFAGDLLVRTWRRADPKCIVTQ